MILAAGEGRRLRPITDETPKALVEVGGVPLLERVARRLVAAGAHRIIVNAHHRAERIEAFLEGFDPGAPVLLSREDEVAEAPLETGGGLAHAAPLFEADAPFFLHNADIVTDLDLADVYRAHLEGAARDGRLGTLVVTRRRTTRPLLIDDRGVYGRANRAEGWELVARHPEPDATTREVGFAGIHVLTPRIFGLFREKGAFSLTDSYMRLVAAGERLAVYDATGSTWHDVGTPERLEAARRALVAAGDAS